LWDFAYGETWGETGDRRVGWTPYFPHALVQFFDGAPSNDSVRERSLAIAERSDAAQNL